MKLTQDQQVNEGLGELGPANQLGLNPEVQILLLSNR